jgi:hypothetical protein
MTDMEKVRAALLSPDYSHSRARRWCGQTVVSVYHHAPQSPSGVLHVAGTYEAEYESVLRELRAEGIAPAWAGPLSPTEPR